MKWSILRVARILEREDRRKILTFTVLRVLANSLDLVGIAGISVLAIAFGAFTESAGRVASVNLPFVGDFAFSEREAVLLALVVVVVFVSKSGFSILLNLKTALFIARLEVHLSTKLAKDFFLEEQTNVGADASLINFQNRAIYSTTGIKTYLNSRIVFLSEGSLLVSLLIVFLITNPFATLASAAYMSAILLILNKLINSKLTINGQKQLAGSQMSLQVSRDLFNIKREAQTRGVVSQWLHKFREGREKLGHSEALLYTLNGLPRHVVETSLVLGIFLLLGGVVVFSDIPSQAVTMGVFLAGGLRIMASVIPLQGAINGMRVGASTGQLALQALEYLFSNEQETSQTQKQKIDPHSGLIFDEVSFSHKVKSGRTIDSVSFRIEPSSMVAIVGPSGAGKTTLFELAMGFLVPHSGEVSWGNLSAREILLHHPGFFAYVPQTPHLVSGSLLENVSLLPKHETDSSRVKEALTRSGLEHLTKTDNWESRAIDPDTAQLSGGEIQRLSLSRALYGDPSVIFLDEATSALDAETELGITQELQKLRGQMTVVLIAHRLSTVKQVDEIIYLDNGRIVAQGTFDYLMSEVKDFAQAVDLLGLRH